MKITKLFNTGIMLEGKNKGLFKWEQIKYIGLGNIHPEDKDDMDKDCQRIIDLIYNVDPDIIKLIRIQENEIDYEKLFKESQTNRDQNFQKLIKILLNFSKAPVIPNNDNKDNHDTDQSLPEYKSLESYETSIISSLV
jgi:hypothetical protein